MCVYSGQLRSRQSGQTGANLRLEITVFVDRLILACHLFLAPLKETSLGLQSLYLSYINLRHSTGLVVTPWRDPDVPIIHGR